MDFTEKTYVWVVWNTYEEYVFGVFSSYEKAEIALSKRRDRHNFEIEEMEVE